MTEDGWITSNIVSMTVRQALHWYWRILGDEGLTIGYCYGPNALTDSYILIVMDMNELEG